MRNRWKGFVLGLIGSNLGLIAMTFYQVQVAPAVAGQLSGHGRKDNGNKGRGEGRDQGGQGQGHANGVRKGPLDSIALVGKHHKKGETSTAAVGRIAYRLLSGKEPAEDETRKVLSYVVHWGYGMLMGGLYGAARGGVRFPDLRGGLLFALGLWAFGDELAVPPARAPGGSDLRVGGRSLQPPRRPPALRHRAGGRDPVVVLRSRSDDRARGLSGPVIAQSGDAPRARDRMNHSWPESGHPFRSC
jgi:hypothetical protein